MLTNVDISPKIPSKTGGITPSLSGENIKKRQFLQKIRVNSGGASRLELNKT